jgi:adenylate cyclase
MTEAGGTGGGGSGPDEGAVAPSPVAEPVDADVEADVEAEVEADVEAEVDPDVDAKDVTERLLGRPLDLARRDVTREAAVSLLSAQKFWRALGFPVVYTDDELFTDADAEALRTVAGIVRGGVDEALALSMTRAVARSADRLAVWQAQLVAEAVETELSVARAGDHEDAGADSETRVVPSFGTAAETARRMADLADQFEPLLVYAWRRHLRAAISRMLADADPESYGLVKMRSVGFADLVNFTSLVRKLSERDLAKLVHRFERLSADVITAHGGRLIKTVGDEVLFTTVQAAPAAAIALDLVDTITHDDVLPEVRCGMARGPIVSSLGDVFGTTVNRASRLTAVAQAGSVLVDATMARELATLSGFALTGQRRRILRGVGPVSPSILRRASTEGRRAT